MRKKIIAATAVAALLTVGTPAVAKADTGDLTYMPWYLFAANEKEVPEMVKKVKQTVRFVDKKGKKLAKDNVQYITFYREAQYDRDTKKVTGSYSAWDGPKKSKAVDVYEFTNYTPSQLVVPAQNYTATSKDLVIKVVYTKIKTKKVTRTIKMYTPKGTKKKLQKAYLKKVHGKWTTSRWPKYTAPKYKGYTASKKTVKASKVTSKTKNQTVVINYLRAK